MYIINVMWLVAPIALLTILFILLMSKSLIKSKKVFFAFFVLILIYAILGVACYYFYEEFFSNQYISLLISLSCIGLGGFINLIIVYLGIAKLKIKNINENYKFLKRNLRRKYFFLKNINSITNLEKDEEKKSPGRKKTTKSNIEFDLSLEIQKIIGTIKLLSDELLNLVKLEENDKTKNVEENLARTINYMSNVLYNQLKKEVINFKEAKFNEFATYIQAEKILLDNIDELRENMYNYIYKIKRRLREIKE